MGIAERLKELEDELHRTQKNKATEYHIGVIKSKIAKLRRELVSPRKIGGGGGAKKGFDVKKSGDATVAIIGFPSVGKSTLLTKLTNAQSKIAAYAFTTLKCIPGIMEYKSAKIQVLDLPGIIEGAKDGRGRGREVIAVARSADLLLIMIEVGHPEHYEKILTELEGFGIRVNKKAPDISIGKAARGGITIEHTVKLTKISESEILAALNEYSYYSCNIVFRNDVTIDELIDVLEGNRVYLPAVITVSKSDSGKLSLNAYPKGAIPISAQNNLNISLLRDEIYDKLNLIKIYTKRHGEEADMNEPLIVRTGISVAKVCESLHRDLKNEFRYALIWGRSAKHPGQRVGIEHILQDGDIVQIVKK